MTQAKSTLWAQAPESELLELAHVACGFRERAPAERSDLREIGRGLRTDDPIGLGKALLLTEFHFKSLHLVAHGTLP